MGRPKPRVDEWLAAFSEGDDVGIELARAAIDEMFDGMHPPVALAWWWRSPPMRCPRGRLERRCARLILVLQKARALSRARNTLTHWGVATIAL
jgi:hypothetical protein